MFDNFILGIDRNLVDDFYDIGNRILGMDEVVDGCSFCFCFVDCVLILLILVCGRCLFCNLVVLFVVVFIVICMLKVFL